MKCRLIVCVLILFAFALPAHATRPPDPGMIERMERQGTLKQAQDIARSLGNHELKMPRIGRAGTGTPEPQVTADDIAEHLGQQLGGRNTSKIAASTQSELEWTKLDLNNDLVIDERDVLALGFEAPKTTAAFPGMGTVKTFSLLIEFPNYPHYFSPDQVDIQMFGDGDGSSTLGSLHNYYEVSSHGALNITGEVYGWHMASHTRDWYHPDDSLSYPEQGARQVELVQDAILAADEAGADFSQYDNDGDGAIDTFLVIWSGPNGDWATFWWGYFGVSLPWDFMVDGVHFSSYSWQAERWYGFGSAPPEPTSWDPNVVIHETGHALGIPDYYDYDGDQGPDGGVGGMDMMGSSDGDFGPFSKYWLGWLAPTCTHNNLLDERLDKSQQVGDCVLAMPGFDPVAPWAEYFLAQYRPAEGFDSWYPANGMLLWHVDSRVNAGGGFLYNNSYTDHKLLKLEQADGLDEIENGIAGGNAGDYFQPGNIFDNTSYPSSKLYDGTVTGLTVEDIQDLSGAYSADFILYSSQPPNVDITAPNPGDTVSGATTVSVTASDDGSMDKLQLLIDDQVVAETSSSTLDYDWNTLVDFNKPLNIVARAWDNEGQAGSATIGVIVDNSGLTTYSDDFESGLDQWRGIHVPLSTRGQLTQWATRSSPSDPNPPGGNEAWVAPATGSAWHGCNDLLRSQRIDTSAFTRPLHLRFDYRARGNLLLEYTADEGASWVRVGTLSLANDWASYNVLIDVPQGGVYLRLAYTGDVREDDSAGWGANIDEVFVREAPSGAPTVQITSHNTGDVVTGQATFTANANDDIGLANVKWYVMDGLVATNINAPWEYSRNTLYDDNHPGVRLKAVAEDIDGLPSLPAEVTVAFRNPRNYPVADDIESGIDAWSFQNDNKQPQWQETTTDAFSPTHSIGLLGGWENGNFDGLWYSGPPVTQGRRCIDLSDTTVTTPELTFRGNLQQASGGGIAVYFYTTWGGFQDIGWVDNSPGWQPYAMTLERFIGQSGVVVWWHWGSDIPDGTGVWLDDIGINNMWPRLDSISSGNILNGDVITLKGTGFGATRGSSTVTFAAGVIAASTDYVSWSNKRIDVRVPNLAESGDVFVTVNDKQTNALPLVISGFVVTLSGLDPAKFYYRPGDVEPLTVTLPPGCESVDLLVDGVVVDTSTVDPFSDLAVDFARVRNGPRQATVAAHRSGYTATSDPLQFNVFSLLGDADGSGTLDAADATALQAAIPMSKLDALYRPWYDTTGDEFVREDDLSYIGYNFGQTLP
ncbi:MAG: M6 family metalloprotease domain-containing protein [bacterium]|nr:M6 family metalloprotease domain-containing protein [bacterium]